MHLSDIIGPVMVGPSSSHTAGAVRIGDVSRRLLGEDVTSAEILFHGSFQSTGKGHGTDRAVVAGLLGMKVDDPRIADSFTLARKVHLHFSLGSIDLGEDAHPNSVKLDLKGACGNSLSIVAASIGGGQIRIVDLDGLPANFNGELPTLIVHHLDQPGHVAEVTATLQRSSINLATMQLYRTRRGGSAVMVLECDQEIPRHTIEALKRQDGIRKVTYLSLLPKEGDEFV